MWGVLRWRPGRLLLLLAGPALVAGLCVLLTWLVPVRPLLAGGTAAPAPADLAPKYRAFLDEVAPLISERERQVFLSLTRDYQRDDFIQRFWDVRDPYPETPRNELRDAWEERLKAAQERFGNVVEDRARVLLIHGEPGHVFHSRCLETVQPLEIWSYDRTPHVRRGFTVVFVQDGRATRGRYRLWVPRDAASPQRLQAHPFYSFMIDGEVVRKDELSEHFRYRFSLPEAQAPLQPAAGAASAAGTVAEIPLVFQRYLRPGAYTLVLKLEDTGGKRY